LYAFLDEMALLRLQTLSVLLNKGVKPSTKPTLPIGWHWFTVLAVQACNMCFELPTKTYQLHYLASRTSFSGTITSYTEKRQFYWNWTTLPLQSASLHLPTFNVDKPLLMTWLQL